MKLFLSIVFFNLILVQILIGQTIENKDYKVIWDYYSGPRCQFWIFSVQDDSSYTFNFENDHTYSINQHEGLMEIPSHQDKCSFLIQNNSLKIKCGDKALIGKTIRGKQAKEYLQASSDHLFINLPQTHDSYEMEFKRTRIAEDERIMDVWVSHYLKNKPKSTKANSIPGLINNPFVEIHYNVNNQGQCESSDSCISIMQEIYWNKPLELKAKLPLSDNKIQAILHIDEFINYLELNEVISAISSMPAVESIYFEIERWYDKNNFTSIYKKLSSKSDKLYQKGAPLFKNLVENGFPIGKPEPLKIQIIEDVETIDE